MSAFVSGILEQNLDGATYEGSVFDRDLVLRHASGQIIGIFDPFSPISTDLLTGQFYEVVLSPLFIRMRKSTVSILPDDLQLHFGEILETNWKPSMDSYQLAVSDFYETEWILISTSLGNIVHRNNRQQLQLSKGDNIVWEHFRFDLIAVV